MFEYNKGACSVRETVPRVTRARFIAAVFLARGTDLHTSATREKNERPVFRKKTTLDSRPVSKPFYNNSTVVYSGSQGGGKSPAYCPCSCHSPEGNLKCYERVHCRFCHAVLSVLRRRLLMAFYEHEETTLDHKSPRVEKPGSIREERRVPFRETLLAYTKRLPKSTLCETPSSAMETSA